MVDNDDDENQTQQQQHYDQEDEKNSVSTARTGNNKPPPRRKDNASPKIMRTIGTAVGQYVASPVVESMDVNAILERVDWNEILQRVDVDALLDKIDVSKVLDRVDVNRHLSRVDVNRHLERVDYDAMIRKANLEDIIARSTSGVMSGFLNLFRTKMAWFDQEIQLICRRYCLPCCSRRLEEDDNRFDQDGQPVAYLPPRPGRPEDSKDVWMKKTIGMRDFGRSVQFRCSGAFNRLAYILIDTGIIWVTFALMIVLGQKLGSIFTDDPDWHENTIFQVNWFETALYGLFQCLYWIISVGCFGRTIGMWLLGLLMVSRTGHRVSFFHVCIQILLVPLNLVFLGWLIGFTRRDGAFCSDLVGSVRIVYAWDARYIPEYSAEYAMSLHDFVEEEKEKLLLSGSTNFSDKFHSVREYDEEMGIEMRGDGCD